MPRPAREVPRIEKARVFFTNCNALQPRRRSRRRSAALQTHGHHARPRESKQHAPPRGRTRQCRTWLRLVLSRLVRTPEQVYTLPEARVQCMESQEADEEPGGNSEAQEDETVAAGVGCEAAALTKKKNRNNRRKGKGKPVGFELGEMVKKSLSPLSCWQPARPPLRARASGDSLVQRPPARETRGSVCLAGNADRVGCRVGIAAPRQSRASAGVVGVHAARLLC